MAASESCVKKYVVRLSGEEREHLAMLLRKGKSPAQRLLKARILLKADISETGEGWSEPDRQGTGNQRVDGFPGAQATGGRGLGGGIEPQATGDACRRADF